MIEQGLRALRMRRPRPPVQERTEPPRPLRILVLVVLVDVPDLPRVLIRRLRPLGVLLDGRDVLDAELLGDVLDHHPRHIQRIIRQKPADVAHRAHLQREPEPVVIPAPRRDQLAVLVVEVEEPLQLRAGRLLVELPVRRGLFVGQELHWHAA